MATGDQTDFTNRILATLPDWFGSGDIPILKGVIQSMAYLGALLYSQEQYSKLQTRISTATDDFLNLIAQDYFGNTLVRNAGETDSQFRARILLNLLRPRATRAGVIEAIENLTGRVPLICEPQYPYDTGGYSVGGCGYSVAGAWGSLVIPYQAFIVAYRPNIGNYSNISGYGISTGGYGVGNAAYINLTNQTPSVPDSLIYSTIADCLAEGTIAWVRISN